MSGRGRRTGYRTGRRHERTLRGWLPSPSALVNRDCILNAKRVVQGAGIVVLVPAMDTTAGPHPGHDRCNNDESSLSCGREPKR
jgi:hypothetical protein